MSKNIFFTSERNYLKRDPSSGTGSIAAPATLGYGNNIYYTDFTVTHNLGYVPLFRVGYEPFGDGVIYPPMGSRLGGSFVNPRNTSVTGPGLIVWPSTTQLTIQIFYGSNTLSGSYPIYWVIYRDVTL